MSDTNAVKWLRTNHIPHEVLTYEFTEVGADHAAEGVGRPLEQVCKTLVVKATGSQFYIIITPGDRKIDPKRAGRALGTRNIQMAGSAEAEKVTGYQVGGISPFAMRRRLPAVVDEAAAALDTIIVNGGRRGVLVELATADLIRALDARVEPLCA